MIVDVDAETAESLVTFAEEARIGLLALTARPSGPSSRIDDPSSSRPSSGF